MRYCFVSKNFVVRFSTTKTTKTLSPGNTRYTVAVIGLRLIVNKPSLLFSMYRRIYAPNDYQKDQKRDIQKGSTLMVSPEAPSMRKPIPVTYLRQSGSVDGDTSPKLVFRFSWSQVSKDGCFSINLSQESGYCNHRKEETSPLCCRLPRCIGTPLHSKAYKWVMRLNVGIKYNRRDKRVITSTIGLAWSNCSLAYTWQSPSPCTLSVLEEQRRVLLLAELATVLCPVSTILRWPVEAIL